MSNMIYVASGFQYSVNIGYDLNNDDAQQRGEPDDILIEALVAVDDGDLAEASATDRGGHGGIAEHRDHRDDSAGDERGLRFRDEHLGDDLEPGGAHRFGGFDHALVDLLDGGFNHARHVRRSGNHERYDDGFVAERRADNKLCHRQHRHHENDERHASESVDEDAENFIEHRHRMDAILIAHAEEQTQRQAENIGKHR